MLKKNQLPEDQAKFRPRGRWKLHENYMWLRPKLKHSWPLSTVNNVTDVTQLNVKQQVIKLMKSINYG